MLEYVQSDDDYNLILPMASKTPNSTCMVFVSSDSGEGYLSVEGHKGDRNDLKLWHNGDKLVRSVASACKDTIVIIHSVGAVDMEAWIEHPNVTAVLLAHLPGQEAGSSLVDVLWGDVNPSGRLPYTIAKSLEDYGPAAQVLYTPNHRIPQQDFTDGVYTDYRHFDAYNITPRFEFGFGLGYTTFNISDVTVETLVESPGEFPAERTDSANTTTRITLNSTLPDPQDLVFPQGLRRIQKYIYPWLSSASVGSGPYPYPASYSTTPRPRAKVSQSTLYEPLLRVTARIRNTGSVAGKSVAQLYISFPANAATAETFPPRVLRGFEKVAVGVNGTEVATFDLTRRDLSYWDENENSWRLPVDKDARWGGYTLRVAESSRGAGAETVVEWVDV